MSNTKIKQIYLSNQVYDMCTGELTNEFHIGLEFSNLTVIAIQDNYKLLGYYSIVLADENGKEKEFINVYNPSSVCGEIVSCDETA
jgi:hypothetical protein|tara:strand:- start:261 stop:518 length:258 start_codon:yes stop_codon:yes gene_type:complete